MLTGLSKMCAQYDRADRLLVNLGHFPSRMAAQAAILAGRVCVDGRVLTRPAQKIAIDAVITAKSAHPWVSRGGIKLAHAMDVFAIDASGLHCLDIGASTGGFTQVLLARGARSVIAVDSGSGQLHPQLCNDKRVTSLEQTDARALRAADLRGRPQLLVCDASFISLAKILPVPLSLAAPDARLIALFKPQFEVGRAHIGKGGLVKDQAAIQTATTAFINWLHDQGWRVEACIDSPIRGRGGNAEWLVSAVRAGTAT